MDRVKRAVISLSDKSGITDFAKGLTEFGVEILSTGGTAKILREANLSVTDISEVTGFPEILDGRVKTLHPKIHAGLLGLRSNPEHLATMEKHNIDPIDMIVINLYPFEKTVSRQNCTFEEAIENIDIGGPAMLRSAAKNFRSVTVVTDPADYGSILSEMKSNDGAISLQTNYALACKIFKLTSGYDSMIADYLKKQENGFLS